MKTKTKKIISTLLLSVLSISLLPLNLEITNASSKLVYPLKKISKLNCRYLSDFDWLSSDCIEDLPILRTSDYKKYASWTNKFRNLYTVLWWASYKYGWDQGYGWHMWVDIATAKWTPVYSMADWEVINAKSWTMEWKYVSIKHNINWKTIVSNYFHLDSFNVSKWDKVSAWEQIWKVWSTWNSTWNHLHFQIDTYTKFSPIYYDRSTCPYGYYQIVDKWLCFEELEKITVDPLLFLETNGWILNSMISTEKISKNSVTSSSSSSSSKNQSSSSSSSKNINQNSSIFDKNVFIWSSFGDVREVQSIYKSLWYYKWEISGDYNDVLESVIKYQLDKKIISKRWDAWTGNFWPMTRAQTKKDYTAYLKSGWTKATTFIPRNSNETTNSENEDTNDFEVKDDSRVSLGTWVKTEKISRENLLTREELEAIEVNDFLKSYKIDLSFENAWWNVSLWWTETLNLSITNDRGKYFKWSMPWAMTFIVNKENLQIFPEKLYYFTDWKREIKLTWLKEWTTTLYVKVWNVTVKTFNIRIYNWTKSITPDSADIIWQTSYLWNVQTGLWIIKEWWKKLINISYAGNYKLKVENGLACLKKWNFSDLKKIYASTSCNNSDFKNEIEFSYNDTVWWLLVFEYKALNKNIKMQIVNSNWKKLWEKNISVANPKGLDNNYAYSNEVLKSIEKWIATTWFKRWYFMQDNSITQAEALTWIKNALKNWNQSSLEISSRIRELENLEKQISPEKMLERAELLKLAHRYLVFNKNTNISINYKDLDQEQNQLANSIFDKNNTWKENTWVSHFRPKSIVSRWETAYLLMKTLENWWKNNLSLK